MWSEDQAWNRNRTLDPLWKHWWTLHASMSENWVAGTIHQLREPLRTDVRQLR